MDSIITAGTIRLQQASDGSIRLIYQAPGKEPFSMELEPHILEAWGKREMRKALFAPVRGLYGLQQKDAK
jgi:hypothetical protein